ncbi:MAG: amino acid ABC transporter permease [Acidimicrobiales bacterium]
MSTLDGAAPAVAGGVAVPPASPLELDRRRYRAGRARRSAAIAATSTVVFAVLAVLVVTNSAGWGRFRQAFLNLHIAATSFTFILTGMWLNIRLLGVVEVCVLVVALAIASLRTLRSPVLFPLRALATAYVDFFRGLPLLILLYVIGFGLPSLRLSYVPNDPAVLGGVALTLCYSSYVAEVFRAGIEGVHPSQRNAAASLGLTSYQTMRRVVLPQAVRRVLPPLLNDFVALQKDVGLVSVLGAIDAIRSAQIVNGETYNYTPYLVAGLMFIVLAVPSGRLADWVAARARRREQAGSVV